MHTGRIFLKQLGQIQRLLCDIACRVEKDERQEAGVLLALLLNIA